MSRNHNIDAFRVIANWAIIFVHTGPFMAVAFDPQTRFCGELLNQFVRVATPFFFLAAGYFFAASLARGAGPTPLAARLIKRLVLLFIFWSLVYILLPIEIFLRSPGAGYWSAMQVMFSRTFSLHALSNGAKVHLWFLPALICAFALLAAACRLRWERALGALAVALYLFGLLAGAYRATPIGFDLGINTRNGPFFSTIFVCSGFMLHRLDLHPSMRRVYCLIALGAALRIVELYYVTGVYDMAPSHIDYLLGTYPFSVGIFLLLLNTQRLGEIKWMVRLSRYSGGVYCAHVLAIEFLMAWPPAADAVWWEVARPFVALALTFGLVMSLARIRILQPVLT